MVQFEFDGFEVAIERLDASPDRVAEIAKQFRRNIEIPDQEHDEAIEKEFDILNEELMNLPIVTTDGETFSFGRLVENVLEATPPEILEALSIESVYDEFPFREIGNIPISNSPFQEAPLPIIPDDFVTVRDLFPAFGNTSEQVKPIENEGDITKSHTYWLYAKKYRWSILFFTKYGAWSRVTASGWDAATIAGNPYANAKKMCDVYTKWIDYAKKNNREVHPTAPGLRDHFCTIAKSTPERPWTCYYLETVLCIGGGFNHWDGCKSRSPKRRYWTAGEVEVTAYRSGYSNQHYESEHSGVLHKGSGPFLYRIY